jgi:HPt (histidine-containing phosphotransfer) domain-containing protein
MNSPATSNSHPLHDQLALEVLLAEPNSSRSQLPILNLLSSLRDEAPSVSQQAALAAAARSVENALLAQRSWSEQDLEQLNQLLARLQDAATDPAVTFDDLTLFAEETPPGEMGSPASLAAAVTGPEFEELVTPDFARNGAFLKQFSEESGEHLAIIEQTVLVLEDQPADRDALDAIFRGFHTIKGNASFLELRNVQQLAHGLEGLLDLARLGKFAITPAAITLILETQDALKRFLEELDRQSAAGGSGAPIHLPVAALLQRNFTDMRRVTKRLHKTAMSLRMTPVGPIFDRMKRLVRDLALRMNKEVELQLEGSETEFDRTMVEDLADPLLHMVRNALDHGLEPPAERLAAGKPARGCLRLRARHQHGSVVIELSDDGRGLAEEMLIAKAVARGMITPETRLSRAQEPPSEFSCRSRWRSLMACSCALAPGSMSFPHWRSANPCARRRTR